MGQQTSVSLFVLTEKYSLCVCVCVCVFVYVCVCVCPFPLCLSFCLSFHISSVYRRALEVGRCVSVLSEV